MKSNNDSEFVGLDKKKIRFTDFVIEYSVLKTVSQKEKRKKKTNRQKTGARQE